MPAFFSRPTPDRAAATSTDPGSGGVSAALGSALESARGSLESAAETATDIVDAVRPRLRGWLHAGLFPLVVVAGLVLVAATPTPRGRIGVAIFVGTACLLFGTSALYHRGRWTPGVHKVLRRLDHANIFLIIAGTYTAFALTLLPQAQATVLLWTMWIGAPTQKTLKITPAAALALDAALRRARLGRAVLHRAALPLRGRARHRPHRGRGHPLHARGRRLRAQAPGSLTPLVRLPRDLPRVHRLGLRRALRGGLDRGRDEPSRRRELTRADAS